jgi:hypothetical protein
MRFVSKQVSTAITKLAAHWNDLLWDDSSRYAYKIKQLSNPGGTQLLADHPELQAAVFYCSYTSTNKVFLVGICKFRRNSNNSSSNNNNNNNTIDSGRNKHFVGKYTASLFQYGNKLCYHRVKASSVEEAKKKVRQGDHSCKAHAHAPQPICKSGGMSLAQVRGSSWLFKKLILSSSQHNSLVLQPKTGFTTASLLNMRK